MATIDTLNKLLSIREKVNNIYYKDGNQQQSLPTTTQVRKTTLFAKYYIICIVSAIMTLVLNIILYISKPSLFMENEEKKLPNGVIMTVTLFNWKAIFFLDFIIFAIVFSGYFFLKPKRRF